MQILDLFIESSIKRFQYYIKYLLTEEPRAAKIEILCLAVVDRTYNLVENKENFIQLFGFVFIERNKDFTFGIAHTAVKSNKERDSLSYHS